MKYCYIGVSVIVLFGVLQGATSLQCWKCSSDIERSCADRFNSSDILSGRFYDGGYNQGYNNQGYNQRDQYDNYNGQNYNRNNPSSNYNPNNNPTYNYQTNYNPGYNPNFNRNSRPQLENCDDNDARIRRMKTVCVKQILRGTGYQTTIRRCAVVPLEQYVGTCTDTPPRGLSLDFCEYCDYDGCNSATGLKTNIFVATTLVAVLFLLFK